MEGLKRVGGRARGTGWGERAEKGERVRGATHAGQRVTVKREREVTGKEG
jgi:hypothetical protein